MPPYWMICHAGLTLTRPKRETKSANAGHATFIAPWLHWKPTQTRFHPKPLPTKERMSMSLFIEFHLIQNFAPSNLNRDDTGAPKDALFGGYRRARVSSQCFKRAIRLAAHDQAV